SPTKSRPETRNETSRRCWRASSRESTKTSTRATSSRTTIWASPSRRWGCWTRRSQSCRKRCGRRTENYGARRRSACASSTRAPTSSRSRSCGARSTCRPRVIRSGWVSCTGWAARSRSRASGSKRAICTAGCSPWTSDSGTCGSAPRRSPRRNNVSQQVVPVALRDLQRPVAAELERVADELGRIIAADFPIIAEVNKHLVRMKGKLFRPTLLLLSSQAAGATDPRAVTLAAVVELIHLATLVHDDSVDHSVLRRGMPTLNALFSHQVAVIMGDYLYSRAIIAALGAMPPADRRLVAELMAAPEPADALVAEVVRCVASAGGLDYARRRALELAQQADAELDILPMSPARDALRDSIAYAVERRS